MSLQMVLYNDHEGLLSQNAGAYIKLESVGALKNKEEKKGI